MISSPAWPSIWRVKIMIISVIILGLAFSALNLLLLNINWGAKTWIASTDLPSMTPIGNDFRVGIYNPAECLLHGNTPYNIKEAGCGSLYPPFMFIFGLPFTLLPVDYAYIIMVVLLYFANISSLFIIYKIIDYLLIKNENARFFILLLIVVAGSILLNGYGFKFAIERGNSDSFAILFSLWAFWIFIKKPKNIWAQVLLISLATHIKLYPAILFIVLLIRYKKDIIFPGLVINLPLALCLGPRGLINFINGLSGSDISYLFWIGNHSASSFSAILGGHLHIANFDKIIIAFSLAVWATVLVPVFISKKKTFIDYAILFVVTIPLTCIIPSVSHDYKLVFLLPDIIIYLAWVGIEYLFDGKLAWLIAFIAGSGLYILLSISTTIIQAELSTIFVASSSRIIILSNKLPLIISFELLAVASYWLFHVAQIMPSISLSENLNREQTRHKW